MVSFNVDYKVMYNVEINNSKHFTENHQLSGKRDSDRRPFLKYTYLLMLVITLITRIPFMTHD